MADVKLPISANVKGVTDELDKIPTKVEQITARLKKAKWTLFDLKAFEADLKRAEQLANAFQQKFGGGFGVGGGGSGGYGPGAPSYPPAAPGLPPQRPGVPGRRRGRGAYTHAPELYDVAQNFSSGVGGGFSVISSYGTRGAIAGANAGGFMGGAAGLLRGAGIGALAYGALKIGQGVSEGYDLNKERLGSLDNLKRQMGDLGVSFQYLKNVSESTAAGLNLTSRESAKLMEEFNRASRGVDGGIGGLGDATRTAIGVSRAYGIDPSVGVGFFGGMKGIDRKQNDRELMVMLADTIEKSGMNARADEVMQAIQSFAAATTRMTLSSANLPAYTSAYGSLMSGRTPGMTGEVAAGILSQANASVMHMGNAGEAGQNFTLTALSRYGSLDPIQAQALAEGGLFGTRRSVFGNKDLVRFLGDAGSSGPNADVTNFRAIREHLYNMGGPRSLQLDTAKRFFGVSSLTQAATLLGMNDNEEGNLHRALRTLNISPDQLTPSGIETMAKIGGTASRDELLAAAKNGRQETEYTKLTDISKTLDDIKINTGDVLIKGVTKTADAVSWIAEKFFRKPASDGFVSGGGGVFRGRGGTSTFEEPGDWVGSSNQAKAPASDDKKKLISDLERKYGIPSGILYGMWGTESSFGKNLGPSSAGAVGNFQFLPETAIRYGVKFGDFASEAEAAAKYVSDLYKQRGTWKGALFGYSGVVNNTAAGEDYVRNVQKYGGVDITQLPVGHQQSAPGRGGSTQNHYIHGSFILTDPRGKPLSEELVTRMSVPSGAGTQ